MCHAIEYLYHAERFYTTSGARGSRLPVQLRSGHVLMVLWAAQGRRFYDKPEVRIEWPDSPVIALDELKRGAWADLQPRPVKIPATRFAFFRQLDAVTLDDSRALRSGEFIQGALVRHGTETAVYVVSTDPPSALGVISSWPRIVGTLPAKRLPHAQRSRTPYKRR